MTPFKFIVVTTPYHNTVTPFKFMVTITLYQMRHLFVVVDVSRCMAEKDLKPDRIICTVKVSVMAGSVVTVFSS